MSRPRKDYFVLLPSERQEAILKYEQELRENNRKYELEHPDSKVFVSEEDYLRFRQEFARIMYRYHSLAQKGASQ